MLNWKTTIAGLLAALLPVVRGLVPAPLAPAVDGLAAAAIAALGYFAADKR